MFRLNYQGDFHKLFVQGLDDYEKIYDPKKHFGRIIPVIQSSATGKSRMVKEVGNEVRFPLTLVLKTLTLKPTGANTQYLLPTKSIS